LARKAEIILEYQNYIESPPIAPNQLYGQACANDSVTIDSWRKIWLDNIRANKARFGSFSDHSIGKLYQTHSLKPAVIAGSGPSLKVNGDLLKERGGVPLISCLHNFHYFEDRGISVDFYVTLDAGPVVLEEVSEGGTKTADEYWALTKDKKLIAFIGTDPRLFEKWQGEVYFFNAPVPDKSFQAESDAIEPFFAYISNGGNVLGACLYFAKGWLGCNPIAFVGADFAFGYDKKFHAWDSKYDKNLGYVLKAVDVYGNKVLTWQSYANFKAWFDYVAVKVPGIYINCTEGGTFGAYSEGNIMAVRQMELSQFIGMYRMSEHIKGQAEKPYEPSNVILF
jgi:hypothetical protein